MKYSTIVKASVAAFLLAQPIAYAGVKEFFEKVNNAIMGEEGVRQVDLEKFVRKYWGSRQYPKQTRNLYDDNGVLRKCSRRQDFYSFWYQYNDDATEAIVSGDYRYVDEFDRKLAGYQFVEDYYYKGGSWHFKGMSKNQKELSLEDVINKIKEGLQK